MNNHGLTAENIMRTLPTALKQDTDMCALATSIAGVLSVRTDEINRILVYPRIDQLPEPLIDILADDFKVDWYDYSYDLAVKRAVLKGSFLVHRTIGTTGSVESALCSIYPGSEVEEWFNYDGHPYYFRILLDVTHQMIDISNDAIIRAVNMYKAVRAHLDAVICRSRLRFNIDVGCGYVPYQIRACGTYPVVATQGGVTEDSVSVYEKTIGTNYAVPMSGQSKTGRHPHIATQGAAAMGGFGIGETGEAAAYSSKLCGSAPGSIL